MVCEDKIVCEKSLDHGQSRYKLNVLVTSRANRSTSNILAGMMQEGVDIRKIIVEQSNEIAWSER